MSLQHTCRGECRAGCWLLLMHRFTPRWPDQAGPTSALASHISSRGPPQCHARRPAGHSALRRCHFCTRSPVLFLFNCNIASRWLHVEHVRRSWQSRAPGEACRASWAHIGAYRKQRVPHSQWPILQQCLQHCLWHPARKTTQEPSIAIPRDSKYGT